MNYLRLCSYQHLLSRMRLQSLSKRQGYVAVQVYAANVAVFQILVTPNWFSIYNYRYEGIYLPTGSRVVELGMP